MHQLVHPARRLVAAGVGIVLGVGLVACGGPTPPSPAASQAAGEAQRASDVQGPFRLTFELPGTTFRAGEEIQGVATLATVGAAPVVFGSSGGGPFVFDFEELNGRRHVGGAMTADCSQYRLEPGRPMTSPVTKSGGFSADDPEAAFYRAFLAEPIVSLPAGEWRITAGVSLVEGEGCSGASRSLAAPIVVRVLP